jgi:transcriptional regulator with XRE-family HTH domain
MGRAKRPIPVKLPSKLKQIRESLGLSQGGMVKKLGIDYDRSAISSYERGEKDPPLGTLLLYARTVNISIDILADDEVELPKRLSTKKPTR